MIVFDQEPSRSAHALRGAKLDMTVRTTLRILAGFAGASLAMPAQAATHIVENLARGVVAVPEPSQLALFVLGVAGVVIGHRASRKRDRNDDGDLDL